MTHQGIPAVLVLAAFPADSSSFAVEGALYFFVGLVVISVIAVIVGIIRERDNPWRDENGRGFAQHHGFSFEATGTPGLPDFPVFKDDHWGRIERQYLNVLRGKWHGYDAVVFQYKLRRSAPWDIGWTRHVQTLQNRMVAAFYLPGAALPPFQLDLTKFRLFSKDPQSLPFASHPELAKRYLLQGKNAEEIARVLGPAVLDLLSAPDFDHRTELQGAYDWLLVHRSGFGMWPGSSTTPDQLTSFLHRAGRLAEMILGYRKHEQTSGPAVTQTPWEKEKAKALEERLRVLVSMGQVIDAVELAASEGKMSLADAKNLVRRLSEPE